MSWLEHRPVLSSIAALLTAWIFMKVYRILQERKLLQKRPGPPCHPIFGHLISTGKIAVKLPKRAHPQQLIAALMREYDLPPVFYLDNRPAAADVSMIITDPDAARAVSESGLLKHPSLSEYIEPLAGKYNMLTMEGALWKKWRAVFNPGLSIQQIMSQVPAIVECAEVFINILDEHARANRVFRLEEETTKITIDVIGRVICDHDFKTLTTDSEFMQTMRKTLAWMPDPTSLNPLHQYHPLRPLVWKFYKRKLDNYVGRILDEKFANRSSSVKQQQQQQNETMKKKKKKKPKTGIDLALQEYFKEIGQDVDSQDVTMDAEFRRFAIDNLLVLLFAGHDTTASTLCYCYHLLQKHPKELVKARKELDDVFGIGVNASEQLKNDPYVINKCEYTLALLKEVLRLWPPASTVRTGQKGYFVKDPITGDMLPTESHLVWVVSIAMGRSGRIWGADVDEFRPERFLPQNAGNVPLDGWRPFEKGPRNCIGQELALIEIKVLLALTLREFDIKAAYDELGALDNDGTLWSQDASFKKGTQKVFGEDMYQILLASGKPREGMPARVWRRGGGRSLQGRE